MRECVCERVVCEREIVSECGSIYVSVCGQESE